jgi:hypothetical protein
MQGYGDAGAADDMMAQLASGYDESNAGSDGGGGFEDAAAPKNGGKRRVHQPESHPEDMQAPEEGEAVEEEEEDRGFRSQEQNEPRVVVKPGVGVKRAREPDNHLEAEQHESEHEVGDVGMEVDGEEVI